MDRISGFLRKAGKKLKLADGLTMCLALCLLIGSLVFAAPAEAAEGENNGVVTNVGGTEVTIGRFSRIVADAYSRTMASAYNRGGALAMYLSKMDFGRDPLPSAGNIGVTLENVGNFLGVTGEQKTEDAGQIWVTQQDSASKQLTVDIMAGFYSAASIDQKNAGSNIPGVDTSQVVKYIVFGSALNSMGIDEFRDAKSNSDGIRMIAGYAAYICYILAYSATGIMNSVITFLSEANIFSLVADTGTEFIRNLVGESAFLDEVESIIKSLRSMRFLILTFCVLGVVFTMSVWKSVGYQHKQNVQDKWRKILYQVIIMAIGIPLVGMLYTECLDLVQGGLEDTERIITGYVFQEFVDFDGWTIGSVKYEGGTGKEGGSRHTVGNRAFALSSVYPQGTDGTVNITFNLTTKSFTFSVNDGETLDLSKLALSINQYVYGDDVIPSDAYNKRLSALFGDSSNNTSYSDLLDVGTGAFDAQQSYDKARDLLLRYARSGTVMPDNLNKVFTESYIETITNFLPADESDSARSNQAFQEQLFGDDSSSQHLWDYVGFDDSSQWVTPEAGSNMTVTVAGQKVHLYGAPICGTANNCLKIESTRGTSGPVLGSVLHNPTGGINISSGESQLAEGGGEGYVSYNYMIGGGGMSPLSLYNYMHSSFVDGTLSVYDPAKITNQGVGMMHYAVTTPYSGIPEIVQLLYTIVVMFSVGIIGWVFGISLLMNSIVQLIKAIPAMFKMILGSVQGFVEGILIVLSIFAEAIVTMFLYTQSINIIDFLIKLVKKIVDMILRTFGRSPADVATAKIVDPEMFGIMSGLISMLLLLWGTFQLIKWRVAITTTIKSIFTHVLNKVFGTQAEMPTGATSGMMKAGAALAAGAVVAGSLAENGQLEDVVNDLTQSDIGSDISEKMSEGDYEGALEDVKSFAAGEYPRGASATADAEKALGDGEGGIGGANAWQSLTPDQEKEIAENGEYGDEALAAAHEDVEDAKQEVKDAEDAVKRGEPGADEQLQDAKDHLANAEAKENSLRDKRALARADLRAKNYEQAQRIGVADYGDHMREEEEAVRNGIDTNDVQPDDTMPDEAEEFEKDPNTMKPMTDPETGEVMTDPKTGEPIMDPKSGKPKVDPKTGKPIRKKAELDRDGQAAYTAAKDGDNETLRSAAQKYDSNGLTDEDRDDFNQWVKDHPDATPEETAARLDSYAEKNFGADHEKVVDQINKAAGRQAKETYGDSDNTDGDAHTIEASRDAGKSGKYDIKDNNTGDTAKDVNANGEEVTKSDHKDNADGSKTDFREYADGTKSRTTTRTRENEDGSKITDTTTDTISQDGTTTNSTTTEVEAPDGSKTKSTTTSTEFADGTTAKVSEKEDADGNKTRTRVIQTKDANGNPDTTTTTVENADGSRKTTTEYANGAKVESVTDPNGVTTTVSTDANGRVQSWTSGDPSAQAQQTAKSLPAASVPKDSDNAAQNQAIYDAARSGDVGTLVKQSAGYDANGLTTAQQVEIQGMMSNGQSGEAIKVRVKEMQSENFGQNSNIVIDAMNEAKGQSGTATYSAVVTQGSQAGMVRQISMDATSGGNGNMVETVATGTAQGGSGINTSGLVSRSSLAGPSAQAQQDNVQTITSGFQAYQSGQVNSRQVQAARQMAAQYDQNGLNAAQAQSISTMVSAGASEQSIASQIRGYQNANFGQNSQQVIAQMNAVEGTGGAGASYAGQIAGSGQVRTVTVQSMVDTSGSNIGGGGNIRARSDTYSSPAAYQQALSQPTSYTYGSERRSDSSRASSGGGNTVYNYNTTQTVSGSGGGSGGSPTYNYNTTQSVSGSSGGSGGTVYNYNNTQSASGSGGSSGGGTVYNYNNTTSASASQTTASGAIPSGGLVTAETIRYDIETSDGTRAHGSGVHMPTQQAGNNTWNNYKAPSNLSNSARYSFDDEDDNTEWP